MAHLFSGRTADELWMRVADAVAHDEVELQPGRGGETRELLHCVLVLENPLERWSLTRDPAINPAFAVAETVWIIRGRNDAKFLNHWHPGLPRYAGHDATYAGAYGWRLRASSGIDQLERAYQALVGSPTSRQVVLQIWDTSVDMPESDGSPRSNDVPCNVCAMLKVRNNRLEWTQILRSNDVYRGLPYNLVQFTTLQEVLAGWLGVSVGSYSHYADSLHVYESDLRSGMGIGPPAAVGNGDSLALPKTESDAAWRELDDRLGLLAYSDGLSEEKWRSIVAADALPPSFRNLLAVTAADDARRRGWMDAAEARMAACSNPVLVLAWNRWSARLRNDLSFSSSDSK